MIKTVFMDLDDVLCDFQGAACSLHGIDRQELEKHRVPGIWDIREPLSKAKMWNGTMSQGQFWEFINKRGSAFWADLEPTPHFKELISILKFFEKRNKIEWHILSSPSLHVDSYTGKVAWIKRHLGSNFNNFLLTSHKHLLASSDRLLIDDREDNINKFLAHGGNGLVFPHYGNSRYQQAEDAVHHTICDMIQLFKVTN